MNCRKVIDINENTIYPKCYDCGKELSPYEIEDVDYETLELTKLADLWLWEKDGRHTILMCTNCITLTKGGINV